MIQIVFVLTGVIGGIYNIRQAVFVYIGDIHVFVEREICIVYLFDFIVCVFAVILMYSITCE